MLDVRVFHLDATWRPCRLVSRVAENTKPFTCHLGDRRSLVTWQMGHRESQSQLFTIFRCGGPNIMAGNPQSPLLSVPYRNCGPPFKLTPECGTLMSLCLCCRTSPRISFTVCLTSLFLCFLPLVFHPFFNFSFILACFFAYLCYFFVYFLSLLFHSIFIPFYLYRSFSEFWVTF